MKNPKSDNDNRQLCELQRYILNALTSEDPKLKMEFQALKCAVRHQLPPGIQLEIMERIFMRQRELLHQSLRNTFKAEFN